MYDGSWVMGTVNCTSQLGITTNDLKVVRIGMGYIFVSLIFLSLVQKSTIKILQVSRAVVEVKGGRD